MARRVPLLLFPAPGPSLLLSLVLLIRVVLPGRIDCASLSLSNADSERAISGVLLATFILLNGLPDDYILTLV